MAAPIPCRGDLASCVLTNFVFIGETKSTDPNSPSLEE